MSKEKEAVRKDLSREEYKPVYDELMGRLITLQQRANREGVGLVVLFEGWLGGTEARISDLIFRLDARITKVNATQCRDERELANIALGKPTGQPFMQEFWNGLGERGQMTIYDGGWYFKQLEAATYLLFNEARTHGKSYTKKERKKAKKNLARAGAFIKAGMESTAEFEQQLIDDGYLVVKFAVSMSRKGLKKAYKKAKKDGSPYVQADLVIPVSEDEFKVYNRLLETGLEYGDAAAPWTRINGDHRRQANIDITRTLVEALEGELDRRGKMAEEKAAAEEGAKAGAASPDEAPRIICGPEASRFPIPEGYPTVEGIRHDLALTPEEYRAQRKELQARLHKLQYELYRQNRPLILAYEGWDAAGKGGNIKRVAQALDARSYAVVPSPAPTKTELAHPHLWRYWTRLPEAGSVGIYDRTWYGRVLVERIEGFATPERWMQAYDEINAFERDLALWGAILLKFWVDISPDEQLNRFNARAADPDKAWKLTDEDWRNREKYPEYKAAIDDMFRLTSTTYAPWHVLESEDKYYARIKGLRIIVETLERELRIGGVEISTR